MPEPFASILQLSPLKDATAPAGKALAAAEQLWLWAYANRIGRLAHRVIAPLLTLAPVPMAAATGAGTPHGDTRYVHNEDYS